MTNAMNALFTQSVSMTNFLHTAALVLHSMHAVKGVADYFSASACLAVADKNCWEFWLAQTRVHQQQ